MKGIAHFAVGVATTSCFPAAVQAGASGNPLYFILGGAAGLLPDTIDFKFYRFFHRHDIEVAPDPLAPDAETIADAVALAVNNANETGKPVTLKLDTIRLGADLWRRYEVTFDIPGRRVCASIGPVVNTAGMPVEKIASPKSAKKASAPLACDVKLDYEATTRIDILDGPSFRMEPTEDGRVIPRFIPWHREWSHSLVAGLLLGLSAAAIWGCVAGLVVFCAYAAHALVDQMGFLGANLFFPFRRNRTEGMKLLRSDDPFANLAAVWLSCLLIFWNLYCALPWRSPGFSLAKLVFYGAIIPAALYLGARRLLR